MTKKRSKEVPYFDLPPTGQKKERARISSRPALGALDQALSRAQDACGNLVVTGSDDPVAYRIGNDAFERLEEIRRNIRKVVVG